MNQPMFYHCQLIIRPAVPGCDLLLARRFTWILAPLPAGGGASNDPELLQALFNAAAGLCKVLAKHITAALPAALKHTKGKLAK